MSHYPFFTLHPSKGTFIIFIVLSLMKQCYLFIEMKNDILLRQVVRQDIEVTFSLMT